MPGGWGGSGDGERFLNNILQEKKPGRTLTPLVFYSCMIFHGLMFLLSLFSCPPLFLNYYIIFWPLLYSVEDIPEALDSISYPVAGLC